MPRSEQQAGAVMVKVEGSKLLKMDKTIFNNRLVRILGLVCNFVEINT